MSLLARLVREPALIVGVITAVFGLLAVFGVDLTKQQIGAVVTLAGAVMALLRFVLTPSSEVVAQVRDGVVVAGPAAVEPTGTEVVQPGLGDGDGTEVAVVKVRPSRAAA